MELEFIFGSSLGCSEQISGLITRTSFHTNRLGVYAPVRKEMRLACRQTNTGALDSLSGQNQLKQYLQDINNSSDDGN